MQLYRLSPLCRATIAPFLANITAGIDSYKWILFGDDDTAFYIDNALRLLSTLDHNMPYVLSDHNWFPTDLRSEPTHDALYILQAQYRGLGVHIEHLVSQHGAGPVTSL